MKEKIKVAFQGEKGAYSHLACLEIFPDFEPIACATFEEAFQLAKDNSNYKIVIPIENSLAGRVADIHYLIPKYKLQIHAEHFQRVNHHLLGVKGSTIKDRIRIAIKIAIKIDFKLLKNESLDFIFFMNYNICNSVIFFITQGNFYMTRFRI